MKWFIAVMAFQLFGTQVFAQETVPAKPLFFFTAEMQKERMAWVAALDKWYDWLEYLKKPLPPDGIRRFDRFHLRPEPPGWLMQYCVGLTEDEYFHSEICAQFHTWSNQARNELILEEAYTAQQLLKENPPRTLFWERVLLDAGWVPTVLGQRTYGTIGMHITLWSMGRVQLFLPPGFMLLSTRSPMTGKHQWIPATTFGFSIRLFDFEFPGHDRLATMHLSMAKAWVMGSSTSTFSSTQDVAGFSISFKKR